MESNGTPPSEGVKCLCVGRPLRPGSHVTEVVQPLYQMSSVLRIMPPLFRNNVTTLLMVDTTQTISPSSSIGFSAPNPTSTISLVLDSVAELSLLRTLAPFYMQLSVARLLLLIHGTSITNLELHGVKISEVKKWPVFFECPAKTAQTADEQNRDTQGTAITSTMHKQ